MWTTPGRNTEIFRCKPHLLIPIAFRMLLVNLPLAGLMAHAVGDENGGLLYYLYQGTELSIFTTFFGAIFLGFTGPEAASIGIIGGADGPTALYLTSKLAPDLLGAIAIAAYSYMALVPVIQPPIIKLLTTPEERVIKMEQLREVSKTEKIIFPIVVTLFTVLLLPSAGALIGMLMLGNLMKESGRVPLLVECIQKSLMYIVSILLGLTVGAKASAEMFLRPQTLQIIVLGVIAFGMGIAGGVLLGKVMCKLSGGKINPINNPNIQNSAEKAAGNTMLDVIRPWGTCRFNRYTDRSHEPGGDKRDGTNAFTFSPRCFPAG